MTKDQLIAKQQLKIEEYEEMLKKNAEIKDILMGCFYNIGEPLNDNILMFNSDQKKWAHATVKLVEELEVIGEELDF